ncbi:MAG TPA: outer membrane protein assembly factor BamD [Gammaproteobacteria bacterium]|jgi:outer membrane protein assembly factor BamD|nr:outer membrane protein assembly factor BamD [Gammaproteobacteria bacterium]
MPKYRFLIAAVATAAAVALAGCAGHPNKPRKPKPAAVMYKEAKSTLDAQNWKRAITQMQNVEATYPFGDYATQAELDLIYAQYMSGDGDSAVDEADRFIREHPRSKYVPYAMYMKGVATFPAGLNPLWKPFPVSPAGFDSKHAQQSFQAFHDLVSQYPNSAYAPDARQRMIYLRNRLAAYDMHVADYYVRRGAWLAAVRRAEDVMQKYPQTPSVPDALEVMIKGYKKLGLDKFASDAQKMLDANQSRYSAKD